MYDKMLTNNTSTQRPYYDPYSTVQCTQYSTVPVYTGHNVK